MIERIRQFLSRFFISFKSGEYQVDNTVTEAELDGILFRDAELMLTTGCKTGRELIEKYVFNQSTNSSEDEFIDISSPGVDNNIESDRKWEDLVASVLAAQDRRGLNPPSQLIGSQAKALVQEVRTAIDYFHRTIDILQSSANETLVTCSQITDILIYKNS